MLTLLACGSIYLLVPAAAYAWLASPTDWFCMKRLPRLRSTLRVWAAVVTILAIDFAITTQNFRASQGVPKQLYAIDTGVVLVPLSAGLFIRLTVLDLWTLACLVGILGGLCLPAVSGH